MEKMEGVERAAAALMGGSQVVDETGSEEAEEFPFIAIVRFNDGVLAKYAVKNAADHVAARNVVMAELTDVASVLVTTAASGMR